jgi:hypothetical protein
MPLYEVLLKTEAAVEVRVTDRAYEVGDTIEMGNRTWVVTEVTRAAGKAVGRFTVERPPPIDATT